MKKKPEFLFTIVHPTARVEPENPLYWFHSMQAFFEACRFPVNVEYILVVHESNQKAFNRGLAGFGKAIPHWGEFRVVINRGENTSNAQGNAGGACATGEILIGNMDDLFPPDGWDYEILKALAPHSAAFGDYQYLPAMLHCSSGSPNDTKLFIPYVCTRARYEEFGYGGHPAYESMFADNEMTEVARRDGVVVEAMHIKFIHKHPAFGTAPMDDVYRQENRREAYDHGFKVFQARAAEGFPKDPNWRLSKQRADMIQRGAIAVCLPGEWFNAEWVAAWTNMYAHLFINLGLHVFTYFGHTSNVYCTRMEMMEMVLASPQKPKYVLWIDDDNLVTPEQVSRLIEDLDAHPEASGVMGWCWCDNTGRDPSKPWMMSCGKYTEERMGIRRFTTEDFKDFGTDARVSDRVIIPCDWSGFPCALFRYEALEALGKRAFVPIVDDRINERFGFCSEDAAFFWRAKEAGHKFLLDLSVYVAHVKWRAIEPPWLSALSSVSSRCLVFQSPGPPYYAAQCKLEAGHAGECAFDSPEVCEKRFYESVEVSAKSRSPAGVT